MYFGKMDDVRHVFAFEGWAMDKTNKAKEFRQRAKELRKLAFGLESPESRDALLIMADEYEGIAVRIEKNWPPPSPN